MSNADSNNKTPNRILSLWHATRTARACPEYSIEAWDQLKLSYWHNRNVFKMWCSFFFKNDQLLCIGVSISNSKEESIIFSGILFSLIIWKVLWLTFQSNLFNAIKVKYAKHPQSTHILICAEVHKLKFICIAHINLFRVAVYNKS